MQSSSYYRKVKCIFVVKNGIIMFLDGIQGSPPTQNNSEDVVKEKSVKVVASKVTLDSNLALPNGECKGIVLFAHGIGSSRHSPRNRYVAEVLQEAQLATLLIDLLTAEEESVDMWTRHLR